jgi:hypothetical protein
MFRFALLLVIVSLAWSAADDWHDVLDRVRESVLGQVKRSSNYTCIQTVERTTFTNTRALLEGCAYDSQAPDQKRYMFDRLRLDIAVSEGKEIFAWHGAGRFSGSSRIGDVVRRGTISSGEFIGLLENIFGHQGVRFDYAGKGVADASAAYLFKYTVPLGSSGYHIRSQHGETVVPFHGSFCVRESDSQLASLRVVADAIPESSQICSAETEMNYQVVKISGDDALIPSLFIVKLGNAQHVYAVSRNQYSQCHAFKAESTVRFDVDTAATAGAAVQAKNEETLPARTVLHIGLETSIDNETSYTGDSIQGVLLHPLTIKGTRTEIPKGAVAGGVITLLEERDAPQHYFLLSIEFNRLVAGNTTVLFRATPVVSKVAAGKLVEIYGRPLPGPIRERYREGVFVFASRHLRLDSRFSSEWITNDLHDSPDASSGCAGGFGCGDDKSAVQQPR